MKISAFQLMPYRELPADFDKRYPSVWVTPPWWELADASRVGQYYNWTLDELLYAARAGFDGVCTNDRLVPSVYADEFVRRIPEARLRVVDGAGHAPQLEHPETVARIVREFLTAAT
jgi:pimeloyl-ACP methyl ester carboxylesterase